jgi:hydrogenase maturation protease
VATRTVVLGVGNILLADEGVGVHAVEALRADYQVPPGLQLIDGGTSAMELLEDLEGLDLLIVIDAVRAGRLPATLIRLSGDQVPVFFRARLSPHQVGLAEVLATLDLLGHSPRETVVLGVEPVSLETRLGLTEPVAARLPELMQAVVDELGARGLALQARTATVN